MFNFTLFNFKIKLTINSALVLALSVCGCLAMETPVERTLDEMVYQLSKTLSQETWEQFSSHSSDVPLDNRINDFLQINGDFLTNVEKSCFHDIMECIQTQESIAQSIELISKDAQMSRDEEIARNWSDQKPLSSHVKQVFEQLQLGEDAQRNAAGKFREILNYLKAQENKDLDVHFFDSYIFGSQKKIMDLIGFGNYLQVDNSGLSLAQVGQEMNLFITNHPTFFVGFKYIDKLVTAEALKGYVNQHFNNMDGESSKICPEAKIMWSKTWSLALNLYTQDDNATAIKIIYEQVCENYLTQGGCIQGRINRGFVGYVCLLTNCCGLQF